MLQEINSEFRVHHKIYKLFFLVVGVFLLNVSCSHMNLGNGASSFGLKKSKVMEAEVIYSRVLGDQVTQKFRSSSVRHTFENGQLVNKKEEIVEFKVRHTTKGIDIINETYLVETKTLEKKGLVALKDLSFPEVGKSVIYRYNKDAQVLSAGSFPFDSEYYVPNLFLPKRVVTVGDTWEDQMNYTLSESGVPMRLKVTSILKAFVDCGLYLCADIEISGTAVILSANDNVKHDSELVGRFLVRADTGDILWQRLRSGETMNVGKNSIIVFFCLEATQISPAGNSPIREKELNCEPKGVDSLYVEGLKY